MNVFQIDAEWFSKSISAVMDLEESYDRKSGERRMSPDGVPQWTLTLAMKPEDDWPSIAQISINSATRPELSEGGRPVFGGLKARHWKNAKGNSGVMLTADTVSATAPSDRKAAA